MKTIIIFIYSSWLASCSSMVALQIDQPTDNEASLAIDSSMGDWDINPITHQPDPLGEAFKKDILEAKKKVLSCTKNGVNSVLCDVEIKFNDPELNTMIEEYKLTKTASGWVVAPYIR